jgi:hypothetical protein
MEELHPSASEYIKRGRLLEYELYLHFYEKYRVTLLLFALLRIAILGTLWSFVFATGFKMIASNAVMAMSVYFYLEALVLAYRLREASSIRRHVMERLKQINERED